MFLRSLPFIIMLIALPSLAAAEPPAGPQGRYCGRLFSNGEIVAAETTFDLRNDGSVTGRYEFHDGNAVTDGWLDEAGRETARKRLLIWHDKYGQGQLLVTFAGDFESFDGYWGADAPVPGHIWIGGRCQEPVS